MPDASTPPTTPPGEPDTTQAPNGAHGPSQGTGGASQRLRDAARILRDLHGAATPGPWIADTNVRGDCVLWGPNGEFVANTQAEPHWLPAADGGKRAVMFDVDRRDVALIETLRNAAHLFADWLEAAAAGAEAVEKYNYQLPHGPELALADALLTATKETP